MPEGSPIWLLSVSQVMVCMDKIKSPHSVLVLFGQFAQLPSEIHVDFKVHVPLVPGVGLHTEHTVDFFSLFGSDTVFQVEDRLLPVGVGRLRSCREPDPFVTLCEFNVEECNEGLKGYQQFSESDKSKLSHYCIDVM